MIFEDSEKSDNIMEYNFSTIDAEIFYDDGRKEQIAMKLIKGGKIREAIFCYWYLLYNEYLKSARGKNTFCIQKGIINQTRINSSCSCVLLTLNEDFNYSAQINLIELKSFLNENKKLERWVDSLGIEENDVLFIGKKLY